MGAFSQLAHQIDIHCRAQFDAPCPSGHVTQPCIARPRAGNTDGRLDHVDRAGDAGFGVGGDIHGDDLFLRRAQDRKRTMRGDGRPFFAVVEVIRELDALFLLPRLDARRDDRTGAHELTQVAQKSGVLAQLFGEDVARAFQCRPRRRHGFGDMAGGKLFGHSGAVIEDGPQQGLQPVFAGDHRLGAPLGFEGQIDVLERGFGVGTGDRAGERIGQLALFPDRTEDHLAPGFQLAQIAQPVGQHAQLRVVQTACGLLAVARDKRHRRTTIEQAHGSGNLLGGRR